MASPVTASTTGDETVLLLVDPTRPGAAELLARHLDAVGAPDERTWVWCCPRPVPVPELPGRHLQAAELSVGGVPYPELWLLCGERAARWAVSARVLADALAGGPRTVLLLSDGWQPLAGVESLIDAAESVGLSLVARQGDAVAHRGGWEPELAVARAGSETLLAAWEEEVARRVEAPPGPDTEIRFADPWVDFLAGGAALSPIPRIGLVVSPRTSPADLGNAPASMWEVAGFDPERPWRYATDDDSLLPVATTPWLVDVCRDRGSALAELGASDRPCGEEPEVLPGLHLTPRLSALFGRDRRSGLVASPFSPGAEKGFVDWLLAPDAEGPTGVSLIADLVWQARADVAEGFPNPRWRDRSGFTRWLATDGVTQGALPAALAPVPAPARLVTSAPQAPRFGVNLIGYIDAEMGLGVAVRRMARALDAAGIPWAPVAYDRTGSRSRNGAGERFEAPYHFNLVTITAEQLPLFVGDVGPEILEGRHTIGQWFWETDVMPECDRASFDLVDEVWGATHYLCDVFSALGDTPVRHVPVPLDFPEAPSRDEARARFGFDERFTVLFSFDYFSIMQRKNPVGAIEAYCRAFSEGSRTRLVLKSINASAVPEAAAEVEWAAADRDDIEVWDRYLDGDDRHALVAAADCYLSLHRSEGLGLTMAEAMSAGTPVVASAHSGNLDFMDDSSALLVPGQVVEIGEGIYYPAEGHWFDPDLDAAADALQALHAAPALRDRLAAAGRSRLLAHGIDASAAAIQARLWHLWADVVPG